MEDEGECRAPHCPSSRTALLPTLRPAAGRVQESLPLSSGKFPTEAPLPRKQYLPVPSVPLAAGEKVLWRGTFKMVEE